MRISYWSSDVCSSDLHPEPVGPGSAAAGGRHWLSPAALHDCGRRACFSGRRAARRRRPAADHGRRDVMRVGMLGSISRRTPPRGYGPWELVTSLLTEALVARGLDVTLFATADSITSGKLQAVVPRGYSEEPGADAKVVEIQHIANFFEHAGAFDILHNQADFVPLAFSRLVSTPMVTTIHGFSSERIVPVYARYNDRGTYVSISDADRHPALRYARTIHHGIRLEDFPFHPVGGADLLFFGRSPGWWRRRWSRPSTAFRRSGSCRSMRAIMIAAPMSRSAMPTAIPRFAMPGRSITASGWRTFPSTRWGARICCSSGVSIPTRARRRPSPPQGRQAIT